MISKLKMSVSSPDQLFSYIIPDLSFQNITRDASEQVRAEDPVRMRTSNILALPTSTSDTAITAEFSKNYLPKILDPNSEYRSLLRDHSQPLKVKLRNRPRVFLLEDGDFTLDGCLFAVCIPLFGLEKNTTLAVREAPEGRSVLVSRWDVGNIIVVPGRHHLVYSGGERRHRCTFLFLAYVKDEVNEH